MNWPGPQPSAAIPCGDGANVGLKALNPLWRLEEDHRVVIRRACAWVERACFHWERGMIIIYTRQGVSGLDKDEIAFDAPRAGVYGREQRLEVEHGGDEGEEHPGAGEHRVKEEEEEELAVVKADGVDDPVVRVIARGRRVRGRNDGIIANL